MSKSGKTWYLILIGIVALILVSGLISLRPYETPLNWLIRGAALMGYLAIFLSVLSSAYMRQIYRIFGRPFVKVHHVLSVTGLVLVTLHAVLRKTIGRTWRTIHFLNYLAFLLVTVHAIMIGTDLQHTIVKAVSVALALLVVAIFIQKRRR